MHDRTLGVIALTKTLRGALALSLTVHGVNADDFYIENFFDSDLDLCLVSISSNQEGVLVIIK